MATSRLIPRHVDEGKSILASIKSSLDYGKDPKKTRDGKLVSSFACDPRTAAYEFVLAKKQYAAITGREQPRDKDRLLYQIRQSFPVGEVSPEDANRIAYELATRFTKGRHAFLVCTHEDKKHVHSHVYFNSTALDCTRKFVDFPFSAYALRRINDFLCIENGLSIIENPGRKGKNYGAWLGNGKPLTFQEKIRQAIDAILCGEGPEQKPASFPDFLRLMEAAGYQVGDGKHVTFLGSGQKKPTRCDTLKGDYTEQAIRERIEGKRVVVPKAEAIPSSEPAKLGLLIDVQNSIKAKGSPGYERWAKVFNLKQAAQTLILLQENNLADYSQLEQRASQAAARFNELGGKIREIDGRLSEISALQKQIGNYGKTRDIYTAYRKAGYSKKFLSEHEAEIALHKAAKKAFDDLGITKIPTIKALQTEYAQLQAEKKPLYAQYTETRKEMKDFMTAKNNVLRLLGYSEQERTGQYAPER